MIEKLRITHVPTINTKMVAFVGSPPQRPFKAGPVEHLTPPMYRRHPSRNVRSGAIQASKGTYEVSYHKTRCIVRCYLPS